MRMDCLSKGRAALLFGVAALAFIACSSSKNKGSTIKVDGGPSGGSGGTGGVSMGGAAGQGGTAGQGGSAGKDAGTGGATSCSDFGQTTTCTSCLEKSCCNESAACSADATCKAFVACAEKCPDPINNTSSACMLACIEAGAPDTNFNALIVCMNQHCATPTCNYP